MEICVCIPGNRGCDGCGEPFGEIEVVKGLRYQHSARVEIR